MAWACAYFLSYCYQCPDSIIRSFTPSIVQSLGYTAARAQLMSVPPFAAAFATSLTSAYLCDRHHIRGIVVIASNIAALVGFTIFLTSSSAKTQYGSLFLSIPGVYTSTPTLSTWNAMNSAPHVRRATAIAIAFMMTNAGGILSTWLLGSLSTAPEYILGTRVMIAFSGGIALGAALCLGYFVWMNQKKRKLLGQEIEGMDGDLAPTFVYLL